MNFKKLFLLTWKKLLLLIFVWVIAVILHNLWYAAFGFEEAVFFTIAFPILPVYFIISVIYSLIYLINNKNKKTKRKTRKKK